MSKQKTKEITNRLFKGKSSSGRSQERKNKTLEVLGQLKMYKESKECTFKPDISLTRKHNYQMFQQMKSRSQSRESKKSHFTNSKSLRELDKLISQGISLKNFNTITEESDANNTHRNDIANSILK